MHLILHPMTCDNTREALPAREALWRLGIQGYYCRSGTEAYCTHVTDLNYSASSAQGSNWYNIVQGLRHTKNTYQAVFSQGSEVTSQELAKHQWFLAFFGMYWVRINQACWAKHLLHTGIGVTSLARA